MGKQKKNYQKKRCLDPQKRKILDEMKICGMPAKEEEGKIIIDLYGKPWQKEQMFNKKTKELMEDFKRKYAT